MTKKCITIGIEKEADKKDMETLETLKDAHIPYTYTDTSELDIYEKLVITMEENKDNMENIKEIITPYEELAYEFIEKMEETHNLEDSLKQLIYRTTTNEAEEFSKNLAMLYTEYYGWYFQRHYPEKIQEKYSINLNTVKEILSDVQWNTHNILAHPAVRSACLGTFFGRFVLVK